MANDTILHPRDVRNNHVLSRLIEKRAVEHEVYQVPFMPLRTFTDREVLVSVVDYRPSGLAPFKADEGSTPILQTGGTVEDRYMEIVTISEQAVIKSKTLLHLASSDDRIARSAAESIVQLGRRLRVRNTQRTMWMGWMAARDGLSISYPSGGAITIDFDLDATSTAHAGWSGSHLPTAVTAWSNAAADVIGDIEDWALLIEEDLGPAQADCRLHVNGVVWRYMKANTAIRAELSGSMPRIITPKIDEVAEILGIAGIEVVNTYYKDEASTKYKFLPDTAALLTGPYVYDGAPIAEMYDGPVVLVRGDDLVVANNPGAQSEMWVDKNSTTKLLRTTTARLPALNYPEAFVWATIA